MILDDLIQCVKTLLIMTLKVGQHGSFGSRSVDGGGSNKTWQGLFVNDDFIEQRAKVGNIWFARDLDPEEVVFQRINDDEDITKLCGQNSPSVIPPMLTPNHMHFVISQMSSFGDQSLIRVGRHSCCNMKHDFNKRSSKVWRSFSCGFTLG